MTYRHLKVERDGLVEHLTLNRPSLRNAFNDEMVADLTAWAERRTADRDDLRVVVLAGAGRTFCAGADAGWMAQTIESDAEENLRDAKAMSHMFTALDSLPLPLVGRVHGAALGGGAGLASVCDVVVAEESTVFGFTEVKLGIVPAVISPFALAKIGQSAARELFLTGVRFGTARAHEIGLVHAVAAPPQLEERVTAYVRAFLDAAPGAIAAAKALIRQVSDRSVSDAMPLAAQAIADRRVSAEGQEGLRAFLEKRKPSWSA